MLLKGANAGVWRTCNQRWTDFPVSLSFQLQFLSSQLLVISLKVTTWKGLTQVPKLAFSMGLWVWKGLKVQKYEMKAFAGQRERDQGNKVKDEEGSYFLKRSCFLKTFYFLKDLFIHFRASE